MNISEFIKKYPSIRPILQFSADTLFYIKRKIYKRKYSNEAVLILSLRKLGDTIFTIPAINYLINNCNKKISILCFAESKILYELEFAEEGRLNYLIVPKDYLKWEGRLISQKDKNNLLSNQRFETIIDLTGTILSASILFRTKANKIVGVNDVYFKNIYDSYLPIQNSSHLMDIYFDSISLVTPLKGISKFKMFKPNFQAKEPILIHPMAGWKAKEWGVKKFIELAGLISEYHRVRIVLPKYAIAKDTLYDGLSNSVELVVTNTLNELISEIENSSILISNDSGPIHIASLLGKATFTIFGPTNPIMHIPYGTHHSYIQKVLICTPKQENKYCFADAGRNGCPSNECMQQLRIDEVFNAIILFLNKLKIISIHSKVE